MAKSKAKSPPKKNPKKTPEKVVLTKPLVYKKVKSILISQPKPETEKNPYSELANKHHVKIEFRQFILIEPILGKDFRKF